MSDFVWYITPLFVGVTLLLMLVTNMSYTRADVLRGALAGALIVSGVVGLATTARAQETKTFDVGLNLNWAAQAEATEYQIRLAHQESGAGNTWDLSPTEVCGPQRCNVNMNLSYGTYTFEVRWLREDATYSPWYSSLSEQATEGDPWRAQILPGPCEPIIQLAAWNCPPPDNEELEL